MLKPNFFESRRKNFFENMKNNSVAVFFQKDKNMKGDSEFFSLIDVNLFYLTGIEQEDTKLILYKNSIGKTFTYIFIKKTNDFLKTWEGKKLSVKDVKNISRIKYVFYEEKFETKLEELINKINYIYYYEEKKYSQSISSYEQFIKKIKRKYKKKYLNCFEILRNLREIKSKEELAVIKKTMKITKDTFNQILINRKSFSNEKEIEAELTYNYTKNFAKHAYHPIVASEKNACILHYITNNKKIKKNSLVLIDSGCEFLNYKTDITRTFPISGKFTKRQKEIYEAVLLIQKFAIESLHEGVKKNEWEKKVAYFAADICVTLKLFTKKEFEKNKMILTKYYPHSTGHFIGLDTHDIGNYENEFKQNQIMTVEPGIYIENENIGIRIEDNVLIRKKDSLILSKDIPKEVEDIEN